tara:strand:- start:7114 stop:9867 length:2754 start_codon:yes stop_codon:yes gene_type:complete
MAVQIIKKYYDSNLMSGSGDLFRNAVSSYIKVVSSSAGEGLSKNTYTLADTKISAIYESPDAFWTTASADTVLKSVSFACSIQGDSNVIAGDDQWLAYVKGGSYEDISYSGIVTAGTFEIDMLVKKNTYDLLSAKAISEANYASYKTHAHTYFYNYRLHEYETQQINSDTKFKALPNLYLISYGIFNPDLHFEKEDTNLFDLLYFSEYSSSYQGHDRENTLRTNFAEGTTTPWIPLESLTSPRTMDGAAFDYTDPYFGVKEYLNKYAIDGISSSASNYAIANAGNLIFNKAGIATTFESSHINAPNQPYYAKIDLPFYSSDLISQALITSDFHNILLNEIAGAFVSNRSFLNSSDLIVEDQQDVLGSDASIITEKTAANTTLPYLNLYDLLVQYSNTGSPLYGDSNFYFVGSQGISEKATQDAAGNLRYVNKIAADSMILELQDFSNETAFTPWSTTGPAIFGHKSILEDLENNTKNEVVAIRIEKIDSVSGEVQNIIIQNQQSSTPSTGISNLSTADESWKYYDTQVVYGRSYTYSIYAYVVSVGFKYEYSDLAVSRQINTTDDSDQICIEFFDPATGETRTSPIDTAGLSDWSAVKGYNDGNSRQPLAALNTSGYATTAQEMATGSPYYADFRMTASPTFKIFECPVNSKTITILDHPPTNLEIIPYQVKDNSQKVGMFIRLESFTPQAYAGLFTPEKNANKSQYLNSNNLLPSENITNKSVSRPRYIEVYRLNQKPTSIIDFEDSLVYTKDLLLDNYPENPIIDETTIISSCFFYEEKITTNHKFYYIARYVSEHNVPGAWSPIQEIELVDDGGYKYIVTDTLRVADLGAPPQDSNVVDPYKKIFRLIPNVNQVIMDTSSVDYDDVASSQISNISLATDSEDSIWGKTFKIRLTSKKTGKKIDLNVTYNLKEQA